MNERAEQTTPDAAGAEGRAPRRLLSSFCFGALLIATLGGLAVVTDEPFVFPSLGPTAFLLLERADSPAASPRNTIAGHAIGVAAGFVALAVFGLVDAPSALEVGVSLSRAMAAGLSLGATSSLMILLRRVHPPAGATTLIVSLGLMRTARELAVLLSAVVLLVSLSQLSRRLHTTSRRRAERRRRSRSRGRCR